MSTVKPASPQPFQNKLFYGDCLEIMTKEMSPESVDLIYLDPPFNSNKAYNTFYKTETGRPLPEQVEAFCDIWELNDERELSVRNMPILMREHGIDDTIAVFWQKWGDALRSTNPTLLAYLSYMTERLIIMRQMLKPTGSIYYHCDPTASHYIKVIMDGVFGHKNFLNEIIWQYGKYTNAAQHFQKNHDVLLTYCKKRGIHTFNKQFSEGAESTRKDYERGYRRHKPNKIPQLLVYDKNKAIEAIKLAEQDGTKIVYREGKTKVSLSDVWNIPIIGSTSKEREGYPTQKPIKLLRRVIESSSNENDVVFDPFCGCATTVAAAHELKRHWIGIDIAYHAVRKVMQSRLADKYDLIENKHYKVDGIPKTLDSAIDLWERDKYQFQRWAVEQVDGFVTSKRSADGGIDGKLYFEDPNNRKNLMSMVLEVKGGKNVSISVVRDLRGTMEKANVEMAGLIILHDLGEQKRKNFEHEMRQAGYIETDRGQYRRMQMMTVQDIIDGKKFNTPYVEGSGKPQEKIIFT